MLTLLDYENSILDLFESNRITIQDAKIVLWTLLTAIYDNELIEEPKRRKTIISNIERQKDKLLVNILGPRWAGLSESNVQMLFSLGTISLLWCVYQGQLSKMVLEQIGLTSCQLFYFFFAAFTGFFAFAFLTIFNMKIYFITL